MSGPTTGSSGRTAAWLIAQIDPCAGAGGSVHRQPSLPVPGHLRRQLPVVCPRAREPSYRRRTAVRPMRTRRRRTGSSRGFSSELDDLVGHLRHGTAVSPACFRLSREAPAERRAQSSPRLSRHRPRDKEGPRRRTDYRRAGSSFGKSLRTAASDHDRGDRTELGRTDHAADHSLRYRHPGEPMNEPFGLGSFVSAPTALTSDFRRPARKTVHI